MRPSRSRAAGTLADRRRVDRVRRQEHARAAALVLGAIKHLINGANPPVHAVDSLTTKTP